jgi:hypothetical protein
VACGNVKEGTGGYGTVLGCFCERWADFEAGGFLARWALGEARRLMEGWDLRLLMHNDVGNEGGSYIRSSSVKFDWWFSRGLQVALS